MTNNVVSLRTKAQEFMFCFQCLYQNGLITNEEKNELARSFKDCLSEEVGSRRELTVLLQDVFYQKELPMTFKQQVENLLYLTNNC